MKIERGSDWGTVYYAERGKVLTKNGTADSRLGIKLYGGMRCEVTWPDGFRETLELESRPYQQQINDMGHEYTVRSAECGFTVDYHGTCMWLPLEKAHDVTFLEMERKKRSRR